MPDASRLILIIDPDLSASEELAGLLADRNDRPEVMTATSVLGAEEALRTEEIEGLFIRISVWDDYQKLASSLERGPAKVVFLSGRDEGRSQLSAKFVDAHLIPPYSAVELAGIWRRLSKPEFQPRPRDFLFIQVGRRYEVIRYADIRKVKRRHGWIKVSTRQGDYEVFESLEAFQERLPVPLTWVGGDGLVNEKYELG
jgi:DNA-binding LytR/AlgR family response regulator